MWRSSAAACRPSRDTKSENPSRCDYAYILVGLSVFLLSAALQPVFSQAVLVTPPKPAPHGELAKLLDTLQLTADQQARVMEKALAMQTAMAQWDNAHKDQLSALRLQLKLARAAGDKADAQQLQQQLQPLIDERAAIQTTGQQAIFAQLTPEQQITWSAAQLLRQGDFALVQKTFQLTPEQLGKLQAQAKVSAGDQQQWQQTDGAKAEQLQQQIKQAQTALTTLQAEQEKLAVRTHAAIMAVLTPEQQLAFITDDVQRKIAALGKVLKLTDTQSAQAKPLCDEAIKAISQAPAEDATAQMTALNKLYLAIWNQVLTTEQRADPGKK